MRAPCLKRGLSNVLFAMFFLFASCGAELARAQTDPGTAAETQQDVSAAAQPRASRAHATENTGPEVAIRNRKNANTVGMATGQLEGLYPRFASDLQKVLDDGDNLRILPYLAYGAASNIEDLLYLHGVDIAFTQSDVLEYYRTQLKIPNLQDRVSYLLRLYNTEVHILAGPDIKTIQDLAGKKVSFGPAGNSAALTGPIIFQRLGIPIEQLLLDHTTGLDKVRKGEIAAVVRVVGKPVDYFTKIPANTGLHFVPIPGGKVFDDIYTPAELDSTDYPTLVPKDQSVETISVPTVLAVFNWKPNTDRYRRLQRFTEALFTKWDKLQTDPYHPKWREINLSAEVPGWRRSPIAERMLKQVSNGGNEDQREFNAFLDRSNNGNRTGEDRERLFRDFLAWRAQNSGQGVARRR